MTPFLHRVPRLMSKTQFTKIGYSTFFLDVADVILHSTMPCNRFWGAKTISSVVRARIDQTFAKYNCAITDNLG